MGAGDSTLVQTPPQAYPDRAAVPRAAPIVVPWPWQRLALGAILVLAAVLNFWQLSQVGYGNTYGHSGAGLRRPGPSAAHAA